ncbi:MAG TPA: hypothetical protein VHU15_03260 [Stellaceae bacterium]|jgi:hypothetical protein|nr:hypothetical protein [Stellaceae bacterium]
MPRFQHVQSLRERAERLREMAAHRTAFSDQLQELARELEAKADELERELDLRTALTDGL